MNMYEILTNFEMSILMGDVDRSYKILDNAKEHYLKRGRDNNVAFIDNIIKFLQSELNAQELENELLQKKYRRLLLDDVSDYEDYIKSLVYYLEYSVSRYNIRYPYFDSKRANDVI
ncbi:hypothetical protein [Picrophilus oshimae]|uniref:Uncharacterized protein n=1 Tax=Picrophilus torridus (strain ATCC 700027 / DSM 9790 / JCM 10055 / NBRC 100828 / KAW 2/3) TaxID=1122961 RepID=A0A8G2FXE4_PICTO|nr:hypothetical protein [Picrophilus oshimae]SMD31239.1 hypothetical protein SAMN02745355_1163 [Picrophilus oshimae DSM 9789]